MTKRIGILTGGGDCPGLNAVIRAVVKSAVFEYGYEVIGIEDGYEGLVENRARILTSDEVSGILSRGGTILGTSNKANPFDYAEKSDQGEIIKRDRSRDALITFEKWNLDGLITIGGDGTQTSALRFSEMGIPVVAVPKTIDNDLSATDVTFGFDSALSVATESIDRLHTTGESHKRVMVVEVMGRYAGWIALRSGIAGGGDIILIPEIPYDINVVCSAIQNRSKYGKKFSIVVVAEGAKPMGGEVVIQEILKNSPDPIRLGGIGQVVGKQIEGLTGLETRVTVLGHLQRGGIPTPFDRWLATRFGVHAMEVFKSGKFGRMVALRGWDIVDVSLKEAVARLKKVDPSSEEVRIARSVGTCFGDLSRIAIA